MNYKLLNQRIDESGNSYKVLSQIITRIDPENPITDRGLKGAVDRCNLSIVDFENICKVLRLHPCEFFKSYEIIKSAIVNEPNLVLKTPIEALKLRIERIEKRIAALENK